MKTSFTSPKSLVGKYVHFRDNDRVSLCELNKGTTMLTASSSLYLKIQTAEIYKNEGFILLTGILTDSRGEPMMFPASKIHDTLLDFNTDHANYIQPTIAHIANPDFLDHNNDDEIYVYDFNLETKTFKECEEVIHVPNIINRKELSELFPMNDELSGLSFRYFFGLPFVALETVFGTKDSQYICYGTTCFMCNGVYSGEYNLVQLYHSKLNIFDYGYMIAKYLGVPFYYGQKEFDKELIKKEEEK